MTAASRSWSSAAGSTTRTVPVAASTASAVLPVRVQPDRVLPGSASLPRSVPTTVPAGLFSATCRRWPASTTGALGTTCTTTALPNSELSPQGLRGAGAPAVGAVCTVAVAVTTWPACSDTPASVVSMRARPLASVATRVLPSRVLPSP